MSMPSRADFELYIRQMTEQVDRAAKISAETVATARSTRKVMLAQIFVAAVQVVMAIVLVVTR
jgi:hypothetical protein